MSARAKPAADAEVAADAPSVDGRSFALGFLAMLPLFVAYEAALAPTGASARNLGEVIVSLPFSVLGAHAEFARRVVLGLCAFAAAWACFHAELGLGPRVLRIALEGLVAAVLLGPALLVLLSLAGGLDALRGVQLPTAPDGPGLARAALLAGGAAWEEVVFRLGLQSLLFLVLRRVIVFWIGADGPARWVAEAGAVLLSSLVFAAAHLAVFTQVFGPGGEPFHAGVFPWRVLAGILLALLFRFRGPGVAAWTHAFFNLVLSIGAGPGVFL
ncbi:MAG: CPBP family intramembrane metalloprotease [Planctomycetes bacterium]|nr:CPBP family intramembrane metalloprotease [Planctomycetota bacterium]